MKNDQWIIDSDKDVKSTQCLSWEWIQCLCTNWSYSKHITNWRINKLSIKKHSTKSMIQNKVSSIKQHHPFMLSYGMYAEMYTKPPTKNYTHNHKSIFWAYLLCRSDEWWTVQGWTGVFSHSIRLSYFVVVVMCWCAEPHKSSNQYISTYRFFLQLIQLNAQTLTPFTMQMPKFNDNINKMNMLQWFLCVTPSKRKRE